MSGLWHCFNHIRVHLQRHGSLAETTAARPTCGFWRGSSHWATGEAVSTISCGMILQVVGLFLGFQFASQGLVNVPFWGYWTSPLNGKYRWDTSWLGDVQWWHLMTHASLEFRDLLRSNQVFLNLGFLFGEEWRVLHVRRKKRAHWCGSAQDSPCPVFRRRETLQEAPRIAMKTTWPVDLSPIPMKFTKIGKKLTLGHPTIQWI